MSTEPTRFSDNITPPRITGTGAVTLATTGGTSGSTDVSAIAAVGGFVTLLAVTETAYVVFGVTAPTATTSNAIPIPAGTSVNFKLQRSLDKFVAYITSGSAGGLYIWQSSPSGES